MWRGNAANRGGYAITHRFALSGALTAFVRAFAGIVDTLLAPTNIDPVNGFGPASIGLACNANGGTWHVVHNAAGQGRTAVDTGITIDSSSVMEIHLSSPSNGSFVDYQVKNLSTGGTFSGQITANFPAQNLMMTPAVWATNNITGAAQLLDFISTDVDTNA